jgi:hypothetical protein
MKGKALTSSNLQGLLNASYDKKIKNVNGFEQDRQLSTKTSKVYVNPETGQTVVAHKGTSGILDWRNNAVYALGGEKAYKQTDRFKEAEKVQKKAYKKYGDDITTIGHSQGGLQAELLGKKGKEIITLNKATRPFGNKPSSNQYDIKTQGDLVSSLNPFQTYNEQNIIKSDLNPLAAHAINTLENVDTTYGKGFKLKVGLNNETTSDEIDKNLKNIHNYHGCFIKDELPNKLTNGFYVINLNGKSHWVVLYKDSDKYYYFDSFGFGAPQEVIDKIGDYQWSDNEIQNINTSSCGFYVIAFIKHMVNKLNPLKEFKTFVSLFDKNTKNNEMILSVLLNKN